MSFLVLQGFNFYIEGMLFSTWSPTAFHIHNDSRKVLLKFEPNFYDLILIDINMPYMDGFQLSEIILEIDHICIAYSRTIINQN